MGNPWPLVNLFQLPRLATALTFHPGPINATTSSMRIAIRAARTLAHRSSQLSRAPGRIAWLTS